MRPVVIAVAITGSVPRKKDNPAVPLDMLAYRFDIVLRGRQSTLFENKLQGN